MKKLSIELYSAEEMEDVLEGIVSDVVYKVGVPMEIEPAYDVVCYTLRHLICMDGHSLIKWAILNNSDVEHIVKPTFTKPNNYTRMTKKLYRSYKTKHSGLKTSNLGYRFIQATIQYYFDDFRTSDFYPPDAMTKLKEQIRKLGLYYNYEPKKAQLKYQGACVLRIDASLPPTKRICFVDIDDDAKFYSLLGDIFDTTIDYHRAHAYVHSFIPTIPNRLRAIQEAIDDALLHLTAKLIENIQDVLVIDSELTLDKFEPLPIDMPEDDFPRDVIQARHIAERMFIYDKRYLDIFTDEVFNTIKSLNSTESLVVANVSASKIKFIEDNHFNLIERCKEILTTQALLDRYRNDGVFRTARLAVYLDGPTIEQLKCAIRKFVFALFEDYYYYKTSGNSYSRVFTPHLNTSSYTKALPELVDPATCRTIRDLVKHLVINEHRQILIDTYSDQIISFSRKRLAKSLYGIVDEITSM